MKEPTPSNSPGDFYVAKDECITCGAPEAEAPTLMGFDDVEKSCYFKRQPASLEELNQAIRAVHVSCCRAVRYRGSDFYVQRELKKMDSFDAVDVPLDRLVRPTPLNLPAHIAERIRAIVAATSKEGGHIDNEAARHGGVALMGTIGAVWLLRPDGTLWDVDDDFGRPITALAPGHRHAAIRYGAARHPWLAELIPPRPASAIDCPTCQGQWNLLAANCPECFARGWTLAD